MAYSDFTLKRVKDSFCLTVVEGNSLFSMVADIAVKNPTPKGGGL